MLIPVPQEYRRNEIWIAKLAEAEQRQLAALYNGLPG